jgi:hypothetical protein
MSLQDILRETANAEQAVRSARATLEILRAAMDAAKADGTTIPQESVTAGIDKALALLKPVVS